MAIGKNFLLEKSGEAVAQLLREAMESSSLEVLKMWLVGMVGVSQQLE